MIYSLAQTLTDEPLLNDEFRAAFNRLELSRQNIFLTGKAGTGKSTFLQYFRKHTEKQIAVIAPTGVAALNVTGQTVHSFFRFKPTFLNVNDMKPDRRKIFRELELLIIDEISMVRADIFDGIDRFLKLSRRSEEPFGGVQLCLIGDLFQLPPVITGEEKSFFEEHYSSPFFFRTKAYQEGAFKAIQFTTIHRQNDDAFITILNAVRNGDCDQATLNALNARVHPRATPAAGTLVLTTTNHLAEQMNETRLVRLEDKAHRYDGELRGNFVVKGPRLPAPQELILKTGAQVMFVKNNSERGWVNGTIGIVEALDTSKITVRVGSTSHEVEREKWKTIAYEFDDLQGKIVEKTLGSYTQFPLQLAWAITIHKSQGKTLERVIIDLGYGAFAAGQLYVALSRCKTLNGIALKQPVTQSDIRCDADIVAFVGGLS